MTSFIREIFGDIFSSLPPFGNSVPLMPDSIFVFGEFSCLSQKEQGIRSWQQKKVDRMEVGEESFVNMEGKSKKELMKLRSKEEKAQEGENN